MYLSPLHQISFNKRNLSNSKDHDVEEKLKPRPCLARAKDSDPGTGDSPAPLSVTVEKGHKRKGGDSGSGLSEASLCASAGVREGSPRNH